MAKEPLIRRTLLIGVPAVILIALFGNHWLRSARDRQVDGQLDEHQQTLQSHDQTLDVHQKIIHKNQEEIAVERTTNSAQAQAIDHLESRSADHQEQADKLSKELEELNRRLLAGETTDQQQTQELLQIQAVKLHVHV